MTKQGCTDLTLDLLNKSPEAGHLLVQLHDKHKLYALARTRDPNARGELAGIMAELLDLGLEAPERALITDVLMSLLQQAEIDLKTAISERLASMEGVPLRLIVHLANEEIIVAEPVLRRSRSLDDNDLIYIVKSQTPEHWRAIATRASMSDGLVDVLAETRDLDTAIGLSENKNIKLTYHSMNIFSGMAKKSNDLAKPLLMREELPTELVTKLYSFVGAELKSFIKENFSSVEAIVATQAIDEIIFEVTSEDGEYTPSVSMIVAAENMLESGTLNAVLMVENLRRGQIANFTAMFSVYCGLPVETVQEMLRQKTAQGLAVACKATEIEKSEFVNIFLLTSRLRGGAVIHHDQLAMALAYYDKIKRPVARKILNQSRH